MEGFIRGRPRGRHVFTVCKHVLVLRRLSVPEPLAHFGDFAHGPFLRLPVIGGSLVIEGAVGGSCTRNPRGWGSVTWVGVPRVWTRGVVNVHHQSQEGSAWNAMRTSQMSFVAKQAPDCSLVNATSSSRDLCSFLGLTSCLPSACACSKDNQEAVRHAHDVVERQRCRVRWAKKREQNSCICFKSSDKNARA